MTSDNVQMPLPVAGYTAQPINYVDLANEGKKLEERYLRWLDKLANTQLEGSEEYAFDARCIALARTNIQQGAMWATRSIFQPMRIALPEDTE